MLSQRNRAIFSSVGSVGWWRKFEHIFYHFNATHNCDGQTDRRIELAQHRVCAENRQQSPYLVSLTKSLG